MVPGYGLGMREAWRRTRRRAAICLFVLSLHGCGGGGGAGSEPSAQPSSTGKPRVMAVSASARLDPFPATAEQFLALAEEAVNLSYSAGSRGQMTTATWVDLEPSPGTYNASKWWDLDWAMAQGQARKQVQFVGIQVINTNKRAMPSGLEALAFDSPQVKARFHALLDKLVGLYKGRILYLSIGNEVDAYLRDRAKLGDDQWGAYQRFYEDAVQYAHTLDPSLKLGVTVTADGALDYSPAQALALNARSDVLILTYYPLQYDKTTFAVSVRDPSSVATDFKRMLAFAGARPMVLQEVGYPASSVNLSSEQKQAQFVRNVFAAWSQAGEHIPFLNFFPLHDFPATECAKFTVIYGMAGAPGFTDFLCSLGLRKTDGTPRAAWPVLLDEAKKANLP